MDITAYLMICSFTNLGHSSDSIMIFLYAVLLLSLLRVHDVPSYWIRRVRSSDKRAGSKKLKFFFLQKKESLVGSTKSSIQKKPPRRFYPPFPRHLYAKAKDPAAGQRSPGFLPKSVPDRRVTTIVCLASALRPMARMTNDPGILPVPNAGSG
ncbi:hypothetical protein BDV59DRAFT_95746 [Aspergillus ambiguus]|uniref:uncharacterized protein n=1 Tax=Aspergillus ambiguus TaxID=176160 RepID=UPI003CCDCFE0